MPPGKEVARFPCSQQGSQSAHSFPARSLFSKINLDICSCMFSERQLKKIKKSPPLPACFCALRSKAQKVICFLFFFWFPFSACHLSPFSEELSRVVLFVTAEFWLGYTRTRQGSCVWEEEHAHFESCSGGLLSGLVGTSGPCSPHSGNGGGKADGDGSVLSLPDVTGAAAATCLYPSFSL